MDGVSLEINCLFESVEVCPWEQRTDYVLHKYAASW